MGPLEGSGAEGAGGNTVPQYWQNVAVGAFGAPHLAQYRAATTGEEEERRTYRRRQTIPSEPP